ncbi:MAG TPA: AraC family transcriptional regulator, partial [Armatimonadota bacterium]
FRAAHLILPYPQLARVPGYHALFHLEPRFRQPGRSINRLHVTPDTLAQLTTQLALLEEEVTRRTVGYEAMALGAFTQIIVTCARAYGQLLTPASHAMLRLGDVLSAIHTRYSESLSVQDLAAIAYLSPSHLARLFHEAVGMAPIAYLIRFRMQHAAELLRQSTRSVADIAQAVGYTDSNYFTRQFKLTMGISPLAYRKSAGRLDAVAR